MAETAYQPRTLSTQQQQIEYVISSEQPGKKRYYITLADQRLELGQQPLCRAHVLRGERSTFYQAIQKGNGNDTCSEEKKPIMSLDELIEALEAKKFRVERFNPIVPF